MEHAGGAGWPGAAPEMESRVPILRLSSTNSSARSTQESNGSSNGHTCGLEKLALVRSKLVQSFSQSPLRLETTNLAKTNVFSIKNVDYGTRRWSRRSPGNGTMTGDSQPHRHRFLSPKHTRIQLKLQSACM